MLWDQLIHTLVGPLHAIIRADCDDGVLHAVKQSLKLVLAGLQRSETFLQVAGGFVERGSDLPDLISRRFLDARGQVTGSNLIGKLHDAMQTVSNRSTCNARYDNGY